MATYCLEWVGLLNFFGKLETSMESTAESAYYKLLRLGVRIRCESVREGQESCRYKNEGAYRGGEGGEEPPTL